MRDPTAQGMRRADDDDGSLFCHVAKIGHSACPITVLRKIVGGGFKRKEAAPKPRRPQKPKTTESLTSVYCTIKVRSTVPSERSMRTRYMPGTRPDTEKAFSTKDASSTFRPLISYTDTRLSPEMNGERTFTLSRAGLGYTTASSNAG